LQEAATRVDFYILDAAEPAARNRFACRLIEKAYKLENSVYALTDSDTDAGNLDDLLWTFSPGSFVPHALAASDNAGESPVIIGLAGTATADCNLLVNLGNGIPENSARFGRIVEIVDASDAGRAAGRQRFSAYKAQGLTPETHNIGNS